MAYVVMLGLLYVFQRKMMYFPDTSTIAPAEVGLPQAVAERIKTSDGETIIAWHVPPARGRSLIIYFHGNAGQIADRVARFRILMRNGDGLLAVSYRGYGGSTGSPSETGIIGDARAAYAFAQSKGYAPDRIVLFGESLGTGAAVALAAEQKIGGIILEAPFVSAAGVAASVYWMFPVRWLLRDQFRADKKIGSINAPLLILHGDRDAIIPIRFGKAFYERANNPKDFVVISGGGHQVIEQPEAARRILALLDQLAAQTPRSGN